MKQYTKLDNHQITNRTYEEDKDAIRVHVVDTEKPFLKAYIDVVDTRQEIVNVKEIIKEPVPVDKVVIETKIERIEVPVIVKETVVQKIEVPVIVEKVVLKDLSVWLKACIVGQFLVTAISLLIKLR